MEEGSGDIVDWAANESIAYRRSDAVDFEEAAAAPPRSVVSPAKTSAESVGESAGRASSGAAMAAAASSMAQLVANISEGAIGVGARSGAQGSAMAGSGGAKSSAESVGEAAGSLAEVMGRLVQMPSPMPELVSTTPDAARGDGADPRAAKLLQRLQAPVDARRQPPCERVEPPLAERRRPKPPPPPSHAPKELLRKFASTVADSCGGTPRVVSAGRTLAAVAHGLCDDDVLQALGTMSEAEIILQAANCGPQSRELSVKLCEIAVARIITSGPHYIADTLDALTEAGRMSQEYLDAMLGRLMLLLRQERNTFKPGFLSRLMGTVGRLQEGLESGDSTVPSPLCGAGADAEAANRRCLADLEDRIAEVADRFLGEDFGRIHELYFRRFLGERTLGRLLQRAAQLTVGLKPGDEAAGAHMRRLEAAARAQCPILPLTLLPLARQYCERLRSPPALLSDI